MSDPGDLPGNASDNDRSSEEQAMIWKPAQVAICHPSLFSAQEIEEYEQALLDNPKANELDASRFFQMHPKFLHLGRGSEVRREVVLTTSANRKIQRVDFFRRSFGCNYWDIIELKHPNKPFVVGSKGDHPRFSSDVSKAIDQAQDYRDLIEADHELRLRLARKGVKVKRPQILVLVGKRSEGVDLEQLQVLQDRIRQRGSVEAWSYSDIYDFAREHYSQNQTILVPSLHFSCEDPALTKPVKDESVDVLRRLQASIWVKYYYLEVEDLDGIVSRVMEKGRTLAGQAALQEETFLWSIVSPVIQRGINAGRYPKGILAENGELDEIVLGRHIESHASKLKRDLRRAAVSRGEQALVERFLDGPTISLRAIGESLWPERPQKASELFSKLVTKIGDTLS